jgi:hypothetical protein
MLYSRIELLLALTGNSSKNCIELNVDRPGDLRLARRGILPEPREFVSQYGRVIRRSTKIAVTGCPGARAARAAQHHSRP